MRPWCRQPRDRARPIGMLRVLPGIAEHELARADEILAGKSLIWCDARAGGARQSADARLRHAVDKTEMLAVSLSARPHRPDRRIDDPDRRLQPPAQEIAVIRHERRVGTGDQEHTVDPVRSIILDPCCRRRIVEPCDRIRVRGAALEGALHRRPPRAEQLGHPVLGEPKVQSQPGLARSAVQPLRRDALALLHPPGSDNAADHRAPCQVLETVRVDDLEEEEQLGILLHAGEHIPLDLVEVQLGRVHRTAPGLITGAG